MAPPGAQKPPPPPKGDQLVSWSQLYRYMDNPFDVMLFTLAVAGSFGSGARKPESPSLGTRTSAPSASRRRAAALARGSALPRHAVDAQTARSCGCGNLAAGTAVVPATDCALVASLPPPLPLTRRDASDRRTAAHIHGHLR